MSEPQVEPNIAQARKDKLDNVDRAIRSAAIDMAIRSGCGQAYDSEGRNIVDAEKLIKGAKAFENYIRQGIEPFIEGVSNKKEGW